MTGVHRDGRRLAVVILTWNGRADTLACLASLRAEIGPRDCVIVLDNGSGDGTEAAVRAEHPWARFVQNGSNLGFAGGNNPGLRLALDEGHRFVWLLNNDTVLPAGAVETLLAHAESDGAADAFQPAVLSHADPSRIDTLGIEPLRTFGARDVGFGRPATEIPAAPREVFGANGAAALFRCDALRRTGLLDDDLFVMMEDVDLAFRLRAAGGTVRLVPAARVLHKRGISGRPSAEAARRRKFWLQRNTVAVALRYWPARWLVLFAPLLAWRAAQALALSDAAPGVRSVPLWRKSLATRRAARRELAARGADRWFR